MKETKNLLFLDTEGKNILREIAIINYKGQVIYQGFVQDHYNNENIRINLKSLALIVQEISIIIKDKVIICHQVNHDKNILKNSFRQYNLSISRQNFICTVELAQQRYPNYPSYSLSYLAKQLNLKVQGQYFRDNFAHSAVYDAQFTRQLYLHLMKNMNEIDKNIVDLETTFTRKNYSNPFSSNKVDDPFQIHPDYQEIYRNEFNHLQRILTEIKTDQNSQSLGAIIIGEAGTGKTHLIMRIAQQLLERNRLLFIRQPNNADNILYHTYSRILESFFQLVPNRQNTQLEYLIAHSFTKILSNYDNVVKTQQGKQIIEELEKDCLSLFRILGTEGTEKYRNNWEFIERHIIDWWGNNQHHVGGYSSTILRGIIRYCRYTKLDYKVLAERWLAGNELEKIEAEKIGLINWQDDLSREEFALEAIRVFGILSKLDHPLIMVFDQLEGLGYANNRNILSSFGSGIKEIITHVPNSLIILNLFPNRWQEFQKSFDEAVNDRLRQNQIYLPKIPQEDFKKILTLKANLVGLTLDDIFTAKQLEDTLNKSSIRKVLNRASDYFNYKFYQIPLPDDVVISSQPIALEERVKELENTLTEIAKLITNFLPPQIINNKPIKKEENESKEKKPIPIINNLDSRLKNELFTYLDDKKKILTVEYQKPQIITDSDDIGKLKTILETVKLINTNLEISQLILGKRKLPEHILVTNNTASYVMGFLNIFGNSFASRLGNFNEVVVSYPQYKFTLFRDTRQREISGKVSNLEIEKLNNCKNAQFILMDEENRVNFDLIYGLIIDIQQKDVDFDIKNLMTLLPDYFPNYWLISLIN